MWSTLATSNSLVVVLVVSTDSDDGVYYYIFVKYNMVFLCT